MDATATAVLLSFNEQVSDFTGHDEARIQRQFGEHFDSLGAVSMQLRAAIFVTKTREGLDEFAAHQAAMDLKARDLGDYFGPAAAAADLADPETEVGKEQSTDA